MGQATTPRGAHSFSTAKLSQTRPAVSIRPSSYDQGLIAEINRNTDLLNLSGPAVCS